MDMKELLKGNATESQKMACLYLLEGLRANADRAIVIARCADTKEQVREAIAEARCSARVYIDIADILEEEMRRTPTRGRRSHEKKRRDVLRAIRQNTELSDRQVGEIAGVDGKTVAKYRRDVAR